MFILQNMKWRYDIPPHTAPTSSPDFINIDSVGDCTVYIIMYVDNKLAFVAIFRVRKANGGITDAWDLDRVSTLHRIIDKKFKIFQ